VQGHAVELLNIQHLIIQEIIQPNIQQLHLPDVICETIQCSAWNKGTGLQTDSIDTFIGLVKLNNITINQNLQQLFNIIYQDQIPDNVRHFLPTLICFAFTRIPRMHQNLDPLAFQQQYGK
jgi:hypothetical protein